HPHRIHAMHYFEDRGHTHPLSSEITPREVFEQRRRLLKLMAAGSAGAAMAGWAARDARAAAAPGKLAPLPGTRSAVPGAMTMEKVTDYQDVTTYNNFYEFGYEKSDPS